MRALHDTQARVMDALLGRRDGAQAPRLLRPGGAITPGQRLQIYRNNLFASLSAALAAVYPVVAKLVGAGFFRQLAHGYIAVHPSRSGNLHDFGCDLPDFLRAERSVAGLPYLPDVAALEWAYHRAYHEIEMTALTLERLALLPASAQAGLHLTLQPCARLVSSRFPVLRIWQANQATARDDPNTGGDGAGDHDDAPTISLQDGGIHLLVVQRDLEIEFRPLAGAELRWLRGLAEGASLMDATEAALEDDPAFDLARCLARHLGAGLFTDAVIPNARMTCPVEAK